MSFFNEVQSVWRQTKDDLDREAQRAWLEVTTLTPADRAAIDHVVVLATAPHHNAAILQAAKQLQLLYPLYSGNHLLTLEHLDYTMEKGIQDEIINRVSAHFNHGVPPGQGFKVTYSDECSSGGHTSVAWKNVYITLNWDRLN